MTMAYDFGGIARLVELLEDRAKRDGDAQPQLVEMLIEVARAWAHRELNPVADSYGWEKFSTLFSDLHYADQGGAFGAWGLPHLDHEFWADPAKLEKRIAMYFAIKAKGGPAPKPAPQQAAAPAQQGGYTPRAPQGAASSNGCAHGRTEVRVAGPNARNPGSRYRVCLDCDQFLGQVRRG
jgi:hypothetical protein